MKPYTTAAAVAGITAIIGALALKTIEYGANTLNNYYASRQIFAPSGRTPIQELLWNKKRFDMEKAQLQKSQDSLKTLKTKPSAYRTSLLTPFRK